MRALMAAFALAMASAADASDVKEEVARAIADAESITLYSLEPGQKAATDEDGHCVGLCYFGWSVVGQMQVATDSIKKSVKRDLRIWLYNPAPEAVMACFSPRHGIRVVAQRHTYDFVVCFECAQAEMYQDSTKNIGFLFGGPGQDVWDTALKVAGVPLAEPSHHSRGKAD